MYQETFSTLPTPRHAEPTFFYPHPLQALPSRTLPRSIPVMPSHTPPLISSFFAFPTLASALIFPLIITALEHNP
ncbi:hypothetical protein K435DRAFT_874095 [Dendrothele bispora CBS 962.96]|uniref:Uncharacterized protein n=1 Tax=Dendrothele bispora (strain CBS 962.96) TaxID=1314807 RepID=A0A4S8KXV1_DENBC|nr:hypothetical protein K435DRAFT_874095 [Dendrothele bispora CBS 962.96]